MAKVLLLNPPGKQLYLRDQYCSSISKANYYWPPIDLLVISGFLFKEHEVKVMDAITEEIPENECLARVLEFRPDCIVFITGRASWQDDLNFVEKVKNITGSRVIASGDYLLTDPGQYMERFIFLDAILMDYTSDVILKYLRGDVKNLYDICVRCGNEIFTAPSSGLKKFNIPVPRHELFPLHKYRLPHNKYSPFSCVQTNFGCPFQCSFCVAEHLAFKYRPVENVIPELEKLATLGVREIFFKDFTFGIPKEVAQDLCKKMINRFPGISWICSSRVNTLDEDLLKLMKKAGCHTIQFGVESASQEILDIYDKRITKEQIIHIFSLCHRLGIKTLAHFILGLPGETGESLVETVRLARRINCDYASFNVAAPIPGSTLRKRCIENNWLVGDQEDYDCSRGYPVIETPLLTREKLWELRNYALKSYYLRPSYLINKLLGVRSARGFLLLCKEGVSLLNTIKNVRAK